MSTVRVSAADLTPLTNEQKESLQQLAKLKDEDIDLSDIPEIEDWSNAERGGLISETSQPK